MESQQGDTGSQLLQAHLQRCLLKEQEELDAPHGADNTALFRPGGSEARAQSQVTSGCALFPGERMEGKCVTMVHEPRKA